MADNAPTSAQNKGQNRDSRPTIHPRGEHMASPRQMFAMLGWQPPRNSANRGTSWDELLAEAEARYHKAKRLRRAAVA